jgi:hypothetical protein
VIKASLTLAAIEKRTLGNARQRIPANSHRLATLPQQEQDPHKGRWNDRSDDKPIGLTDEGSDDSHSYR